MKKVIFIFSLLFLAVSSVSAQSTKRMLDNAVNMINRNCPLDLDSGTVLKSAYVTWQYLVFDCVYDEKDIDMQTANQHKKELKEIFKGILVKLVKDENSAALFDLVAANEKGVEFKITGKTSKKTMDIKFSFDEIARLVDYTPSSY